MKTFLSIFIFALFAPHLSAQSFSVVVAINKLSYAGTGQTDSNSDPLRGANYVLNGFLYPGNYFENNCPNDMACGIEDDGEASDPLAVIGTWSFRGFTVLDMAEAVDNGGIPTYSNQIFKFQEDFEECPGCKISLDGQDYYGSTTNVTFKKVIIGATTNEFRLMRGEAEQIIYKQTENENATGGYNMLATFFFDK